MKKGDKVVTLLRDINNKIIYDDEYKIIKTIGTIKKVYEDGKYYDIKDYFGHRYKKVKHKYIEPINVDKYGKKYYKIIKKKVKKYEDLTLGGESIEPITLNVGENVVTFLRNKNGDYYYNEISGKKVFTTAVVLKVNYDRGTVNLRDYFGTTYYDIPIHNIVPINYYRANKHKHLFKKINTNLDYLKQQLNYSYNNDDIYMVCNQTDKSAYRQPIKLFLNSYVITSLRYRDGRLFFDQNFKEVPTIAIIMNIYQDDTCDLQDYLGNMYYNVNKYDIEPIIVDSNNQVLIEKMNSRVKNYYNQVMMV